MGDALTPKLLRDHLVEGKFEPREEIAYGVDQLLVDVAGDLLSVPFQSSRELLHLTCTTILSVRGTSFDARRNCVPSIHVRRLRGRRQLTRD
jgi:hypothetical protein